MWEGIKESATAILDDVADYSKSIKRTSDYIILLGGASIISYAVRTRFLGKMLRAVEVPEGNLSTIIIRTNTLKALKEAIIKDQPPLYPGVELRGEDIRTSVFQAPHFTEKLGPSSRFRTLEEGSYILWTKMDLDIPQTGIDLRSFSKETFLKLAADKAKDEAIQAIIHDLVTPKKKVSWMEQKKQKIRNKLLVLWRGTNFSLSSLQNRMNPSSSYADLSTELLSDPNNNNNENENNNEDPAAGGGDMIDVTPEERAEIVDRIVDGTDVQFVELCSRYRGDPSKFRWHAINLLRTKKGFNGKK